MEKNKEAFKMKKEWHFGGVLMVTYTIFVFVVHI